MTEFGSLALVDQAEGKSIDLPGVRKGDMAARHWKPEVRVSSVQFSPTGQFVGIYIFFILQHGEHHMHIQALMKTWWM